MLGVGTLSIPATDSAHVSCLLSHLPPEQAARCQVSGGCGEWGLWEGLLAFLLQSLGFRQALYPSLRGRTFSAFLSLLSELLKGSGGFPAPCL